MGKTVTSENLKWSWEKSNGLASTEQTMTAYQALTNKGKCKSFSYLVWNDIVSLINKSLDALYLKWDDSLTDMDGALLSETDTVLTANKFNSVRKQLDKFNQYWYWETNSDELGYVGRKDFVGRSEVGKKNADKLYGRYLIEITSALNNMAEKLNAILEMYGYINLNLNTEALLTDVSTHLINTVYQFGIHIGLASLEFCEPFEIGSIIHNISEIFNTDMIAQDPTAINSVYTMFLSGDRTLDYDAVSALCVNMNLNLGTTLGLSLLIVDSSISLVYQCNLNPQFISELEALNIRRHEYSCNMMTHETELVARPTENAKYSKNLGLVDVPTITDHPAAHLIYSVNFYKAISLLAAPYSRNHESVVKMQVKTVNADMSADRIVFAQILHDINKRYVAECAIAESRRMESIKSIIIKTDSVLERGIPYAITSNYPIFLMNKSILERGIPSPLFSLHGLSFNYVNDLQMGTGLPLENTFNERLFEYADLNYTSSSDSSSYTNIVPLSLVYLSLWQPPIYDDGRLLIRQSYYATRKGRRLFIT